MARIAVSPTKLDTWQDCPRRYWLKYVEKVRVDGRWAHLSMGNAVHGALRDWFDLADRGLADAGALVRKHWSSDGFRDEAHSDQWRSIAAQMVTAYLEQHHDDVPFSRERTLGSMTEHASISGRIDRLDESCADDALPGELIVIDYKTGRRVPGDDDARVSRALAIYCEIVQRSLRRPAFTVQLHHVPTGVVATARHTPESLQRQLARVDALARDIAAAEATRDLAACAPAPGPLCAWCDFRAHCPAGDHVPAVARWAGLQEADESMTESMIAHDSQP